MSMSTVQRITMRRVSIPLNRPYWSMISTLYALDTLVAEVHLDDGGVGYGEAAIVNGYTHETPEGGWRFCLDHAARLPGVSVGSAVQQLARCRDTQSHGVTCLVSAMEMAMGHRLLQSAPRERRIPVVGAVQAHEAADIQREVEQLLRDGYQTLKVKVGTNVEDDLRRVAFIRNVAAGRATLRLDANQGFSPGDACRFSAQLPAEGIELFEQGSRAGDWDAALAIRQASTVPTMLDESIFDLSDIDRAAELKAAQLIKLKLVKCGGVDSLVACLSRIRRLGMDAILGNGVASDISNWMEACVADECVERTGEMNGFTRLKARLFANPLQIEEGCLVVPAGYYPQVDIDALNAHAVDSQTFA